MLGAWINNNFVGVNKNDQSGYPTLMLIALIFAFFGYALLPLIPLKEEYEAANKLRDLEEALQVKLRLERRADR